MQHRLILCLTILAMLVTSPLWATPFDHDEHVTILGGGNNCSSCHVAESDSIIPARDVCMGCHDSAMLKEVSFPGLKTHGVTWPLSHRSEAKSKRIDCAACHQQDECLKCHASGFADEMGSFSNSLTNVHTSDFHVTHPLAARTNPQLCTSCHESSYCSDCHGNFRRGSLTGASHQRSFGSLTVGGPTGKAHSEFNENQCQICHVDSILPTHEWTRGHAREARKNLVTCQACHPNGDTCIKCHSARSGLGVNPHPKDWKDIDGRLRRASDGRTCRKCH
ncbi:MAG: cytochrome c3 family protein [Desulfuromonadaceae bacterium]|nr:cytochrome c3 family protein [Desulfuromonas sp.]MDY0184959.1 cytochrome c3 family protein [Desulfuromonadaceae bacterium]